MTESINRAGAVEINAQIRQGRIDRRPNLLCATDLSQRSDHAVQRAAMLARRLDAHLLLLHVIDPAQSERMIRRRSTRARIVLDARARKLARVGSDPQVSVRVGRPHQTIAEVATEWGADLIILGSYRRRFGDSFLGTTAERVIRKARRPVLVVNGEATGPYEHVLLTSDLSPVSAGVARLTQDLGLLEDSHASIVHALEPTNRAMLYIAGVTEPEIGRYARYIKQLSSDELLAQLDTAGLNSARFPLIHEQASPLRAIEQAAQRTGSDLVVVGASRFPALKRVFLGSVSNEVLRTITRDVLLVSPAAIRRARRGAPKSSSSKARASAVRGPTHTPRNARRRPLGAEHAGSRDNVYSA